MMCLAEKQTVENVSSVETQESQIKRTEYTLTS